MPFIVSPHRYLGYQSSYYDIILGLVHPFLGQLGIGVAKFYLLMGGSAAKIIFPLGQTNQNIPLFLQLVASGALGILVDGARLNGAGGDQPGFRGAEHCKQPGVRMREGEHHLTASHCAHGLDGGKLIL